MLIVRQIKFIDSRHIAAHCILTDRETDYRCIYDVKEKQLEIISGDAMMSGHHACGVIEEKYQKFLSTGILEDIGGAQW